MDADTALDRVLARHAQSDEIAAFVGRVEAWIDREGLDRGGPAASFPTATEDALTEQALLLGIRAVRGVTRFSGQPYAVHPIRAAYTLLDQVPREALPERAVPYTLIHDALEEGEGKRPEPLARLDEAAQGAGLGRVAALLTEPEIRVSVPGIAPPVVTTAAFALQVLRASDEALATAVLADKIDNTLDLEYLRSAYEGDGLSYAAAKRLGYAHFLGAALHGHAPESLVDLLDQVVRHQMDRFDVSSEFILERASRYARVLQDREDELTNAVVEWQESLGLSPD